MAKITSDMIISEVLNVNKSLAQVFLNNGLYCLGCPSASGENIEDACEIHGLDCDKLVRELNEFLER